MKKTITNQKAAKCFTWQEHPKKAGPYQLVELDLEADARLLVQSAAGGQFPH